MTTSVKGDLNWFPRRDSALSLHQPVDSPVSIPPSNHPFHSQVAKINPTTGQTNAAMLYPAMILYTNLYLSPAPIRTTTPLPIMVEICLASSMNNHDETNNSFPFPFLLFIYHLGTNQLILRDIYSRPCMSCMSRSIDIENFLTLRYFMSKNGK